MGRGISRVRETDVRRAIQATKKAGETVQRVEIGKDGKIVVITGKPADDLEAQADLIL
jgi:hypothetical protein